MDHSSVRENCASGKTMMFAERTVVIINICYCIPAQGVKVNNSLLYPLPKALR